MPSRRRRPKNHLDIGARDIHAISDVDGHRRLAQTVPGSRFPSRPAPAAHPKSMIGGRHIATNHANVVSMRCPAAWKLRIPRCCRPVIRPLHGQGRRKVTQHKNLWLVDLETGAERQLTNLAAGFFNLRDSTSGKTAVKLSSNQYWSARMWFCWISASHNPASTQ